MIRGSLQQRLFLVVLFAAIPVFFVHLATQIASDMRTANERTALTAEDIAAAALPLLKSTLVVGDLATAQETLDSIMNNGQFLSIRLFGQSGREIIAEGRVRRPADSFTVPQWFQDLLDLHFPARSFPVEAGGTNYGTLVVEPSAVFLAADIWRRMWTAALLWMLSLGAALLLLKLVLQRGLKPLEDLAATAHCLGDGDLSCRAGVSDIPELAETAMAFNQMAERLVDARDRMEDRIRDALRELDSLITRIPVGVFKLRMLSGGGMRFDFVSPHWCELLEIEASEVYSNPETQLSRIHPDDVASYLETNEHARKTQTPFVWEGRLRDGYKVKWLHVESAPSLQENGDTLWEGIQYDISNIKEHETQLDRIAHYDALTGIPNRLMLTDRMQQAIAQARRMKATLAVCYLDLDGFKPVNDTLGHQAGDTLLVEIARRLKSTIRGGDTVARIGGDEFVLLLVGLEPVGEYKTALERILFLINENILIGQSSVSVSASIGVTLFPKDDCDADLLLRHADQAMYQAKQAGRNTIRFYEHAAQS